MKKSDVATLIELYAYSDHTDPYSAHQYAQQAVVVDTRMIQRTYRRGEADRYEVAPTGRRVAPGHSRSGISNRDTGWLIVREDSTVQEHRPEVLFQYAKEIAPWVDAAAAGDRIPELPKAPEDVRIAVVHPRKIIDTWQGHLDAVVRLAANEATAREAEHQEKARREAAIFVLRGLMDGKTGIDKKPTVQWGRPPYTADRVTIDLDSYFDLLTQLGEK